MPPFLLLLFEALLLPLLVPFPPALSLVPPAPPAPTAEESLLDSRPWY